jgi:hypothetical protein
MNTEQMIEMLDMLTINEVSLLAKLAQERKEVMERELVEAAKIKFIKAYQDFRKIAPNATGWIYWEYENCNTGEFEEQDFNLYEMLDCAIKQGLL